MIPRSLLTPVFPLLFLFTLWGNTRINALLPSPIPFSCFSNTVLGCYEDYVPNRTFPIAMTIEPTDPYGINQTIETCAYLCYRAGFPLAGVEVGNQCFCADQVANVTQYQRDINECLGSTASPCVGNVFETCGNSFRVQVYNYTCLPYHANPSNSVWLNTSYSIEERVQDVISKLSVPGLIAQLTQNGADIYSPMIQLPRYIVSQECLAGYDPGPIYIAPDIPVVNHSSSFPQPVNMGNSFNGPLVQQIASQIADENRAGWLFYNRPSLTCMSPNLNVARAPQWGRNYESFGEDPTVISTLGTYYINGLQKGTTTGNSTTNILKTMAVPKHLGVYSVECYNPTGGPTNYPNCPVYRSNYDAALDDIDLRETYLKGWAAAFQQANPPATSVMCSYNALNGVPMCGNGGVLRSILQQEWNATGFVISDADAVALIYTMDSSDPPGHYYASSLQQAAITALINGTSVSLEDDDSSDSSSYHTELLPALAAGLITIENIKEAVSRALYPRFAVGLYNPPETVLWNNITADVIESSYAHQLARQMAAESTVLLQNIEGYLPLRLPSQGGPRSIAVVGPASNCSSCILNRYTGKPFTVVTYWDAVYAYGQQNGIQTVYAGDSMDSTAVQAVKNADVALVFITGYSEGESRDRENLGIPEDQLEFLMSLSTNTTTPLVIGVVSGGGVDISPILDMSTSIMVLGQGGMEAGNGFVDVLYGNHNPSGALATTWYRVSWENASNFLDMSIRRNQGRGYRYLTIDAQEQHVLYPFGYGLSYTTWTNDVANIQPNSISVGNLQQGLTITVSVQVTNRGTVPGSRVVLVFLTKVDADPTEQWPNLWLPMNGIGKLMNISGSSSTVLTLSIQAADVSRWNTGSNTFVIATGTYGIVLRDDGKGGAPNGEVTGTFTVTA